MENVKGLEKKYSQSGTKDSLRLHTELRHKKQPTGLFFYV